MDSSIMATACKSNVVSCQHNMPTAVSEDTDGQGVATRTPNKRKEFWTACGLPETRKLARLSLDTVSTEAPASCHRHLMQSPRAASESDSPWSPASSSSHVEAQRDERNCSVKLCESIGLLPDIIGGLVPGSAAHFGVSADDALHSTSSHQIPRLTDKDGRPSQQTCNHSAFLWSFADQIEKESHLQPSLSYPAFTQFITTPLGPIVARESVQLTGQVETSQLAKGDSEHGNIMKKHHEDLDNDKVMTREMLSESFHVLALCDSKTREQREDGNPEDHHSSVTLPVLQTEVFEENVGKGEDVVQSTRCNLDNPCEQNHCLPDPAKPISCATGHLCTEVNVIEIQNAYVEETPSGKDTLQGLVEHSLAHEGDVYSPERRVLNFGTPKFSEDHTLAPPDDQDDGDIDVDSHCGAFFRMKEQSKATMATQELEKIPEPSAAAHHDVDPDQLYDSATCVVPVVAASTEDNATVDVDDSCTPMTYQAATTAQESETTRELLRLVAHAAELPQAEHSTENEFSAVEAATRTQESETTRESLWLITHAAELSQAEHPAVHECSATEVSVDQDANMATDDAYPSMNRQASSGRDADTATDVAYPSMHHQASLGRDAHTATDVAYPSMNHQASLDGGANTATDDAYPSMNQQAATESMHESLRLVTHAAELPQAEHPLEHEFSAVEALSDQDANMATDDAYPSMNHKAATRAQESETVQESLRLVTHAAELPQAEHQIEHEFSAVESSSDQHANMATDDAYPSMNHKAATRTKESETMQESLRLVTHAAELPQAEHPIEHEFSAVESSSIQDANMATDDAYLSMNHQALCKSFDQIEYQIAALNQHLTMLKDRAAKLEETEAWIDQLHTNFHASGSSVQAGPDQNNNGNGSSEIYSTVQRYLHVRQQRAMLQMQLLARTSVMRKPAISEFHVYFRGGFRIQLYKNKDGSTCSMGVEAPADHASNLGAVAAEMGRFAWKQALERTGCKPPGSISDGAHHPQPLSQELLLVSDLPLSAVPVLLQQLNVTMIKITERLAPLQILQKECRQVDHVGARLVNQVNSGSFPLLIATFKLFVDGEQGSVKHQGHTQVKKPFVAHGSFAFNFSTTLSADSADEWSFVDGKCLFGQGNVFAAARVLQNAIPGTPIRELVITAIEALQRSSVAK